MRDTICARALRKGGQNRTSDGLFLLLWTCRPYRATTLSASTTLHRCTLILVGRARDGLAAHKHHARGMVAARFGTVQDAMAPLYNAQGKPLYCSEPSHCGPDRPAQVPRLHPGVLCDVYQKTNPSFTRSIIAWILRTHKGRPYGLCQSSPKADAAVYRPRIAIGRS